MAKAQVNTVAELIVHLQSLPQDMPIDPEQRLAATRRVVEFRGPMEFDAVCLCFDNPEDEEDFILGWGEEEMED